MSHPSSEIPLPQQFQNMPAPVLGALKKLTGLESLNAVYRAANRSSTTPAAFAAGCLTALNASYEITPADVERIPRTGPCVIVANHPYGLLEGVLLTDLISRVRPDFKFLANGFLSTVPELKPIVIPVDVFATGEKAAFTNRKPLIDAVAHLRDQGLLIVFPAGIVSSWDWRQSSVTDPPWNRAVARIASMTKSPVLPLFFAGRNSVPFQLMGLIHPALRTMRLPAEFANKRGARLEIRIGNLVKPKELAAQGKTPDDQTTYLRARTYLLGFRQKAAAPIEAAHVTIAAAVDPRELESEIANLTAAQLLERSGDYDVYLARTRQIPAILTEIGRLRETTFRLAGEGTGRQTDLDSFDAYYDHIFVWQRIRREIVGAYRLTRTTPVLDRLGPRGLYTNTLFRFHPGFFERTGPAIELGRSFVRPEYQKEYSPLLLLWKGIARYAAQNPEFPVLFGAVSISNNYSRAARHLMVEYLERQTATDPLRFLVRPRRPFRAPLLAGAELKLLARCAASLDSLSAAVGELDASGRGVPVLLRQYSKLGGRVLTFNVDHEFAGALDGLILVDLRTADPAALRRYIG
ncbi:MAG TPA: GNAT family N-acyltransferase [Bryobacteraceae bacterium]